MIPKTISCENCKYYMNAPYGDQTVYYCDKLYTKFDCVLSQQKCELFEPVEVKEK
ncbi:MAG: hypothetical protein N3I35_06650 [Clostridia bacterium]|nr:hypothetical protein [Clostridia bacterium]